MKKVICMECGMELPEVSSKHTWQDCEDYKIKCSPANLERRIAAIEAKLEVNNDR